MCYNNRMTSQKTPYRIVFMGTPAFAVPSLAALCTACNTAQPDWHVAGVITQPDLPAGRGKKLVASPVKQFAQAQGLSVIQPDRLRKEPDAIDVLRMWAPDVIVVAAYGQILPRAVLEIPTFGCVNVHASLLPAYRGASPISAALLDGLDETGVTIMLMDEGMDTGPMLAQARLPIQPDDTTASLSERLAELGAELLARTLPGWLAGEIAPVPQDQLPGQPSVCRLVKKQDGRIDWSLPAAQIERMIRAYTPWPGAFTTWQGQNFKLWQADVLAGTPQPGTTQPESAPPGCVVEKDGQIAVGTGDGLLALRQVQPAGKRRMEIDSFRNGAPDFVGARLGQVE